MSAKSQIELHSSPSEEERRVTEQDPTGNLNERFRLLVRQVLPKAPLNFSPCECVILAAKRKTVLP